MDSKVFTVVFIIATVIAVVALSFTKLSGSLQVNPSPSPSSSDQLIFNDAVKNQNQVGLNQVSSPSPMIKQMIKQYSSFPGVYSPDQLKGKKAVILTQKGKIEFEIYPEATKAASNFIFLTQDKFYDGLTFHRVEPGFVIQGGDPLGNGTGGPGYKFADEPVTRKYLRGTVAMANAGPNTNGSQFFIMLDDNLSLPPLYTIFGKVISGQEVVSQIMVGDVMQKVSIENL